jgi:CelD/BcsL family acetyltransferase involved in cellulose biosynthesis
MDVTVRQDDAALTDLASEWLDLWHQDPSATPFHTPQYAQAEWETELGADRTLASVCVRNDGVLVGFANLTIDPDGTLTFLGNRAVADYLGPISRSSDRETVASALVDVIRDLEWTTAELFGLRSDSGWPEAIARAAKAAGFNVDERQQDVCPRLDLEAGFDAYLASIDGKLRHEILRKERKLQRDTGGYTIRLSDHNSLDADLQVFYDMHRSSSGQKGRFMHEDVAALFSRIARAFDDLNWLRLSWLDIGGEPAAAAFSFSARGTWSVYNSAYDHKRRDLGPGMVLMSETIRLAADEGCGTFDMLRGDEPYKYRFGAVDVPLLQLTFGRP